MFNHCTDHASNKIYHPEASNNKVAEVRLQAPPKSLEDDKLKLSQTEQTINEISELHHQVVNLVESALVVHMLQFLNWLW